MLIVGIVIRKEFKYAQLLTNSNKVENIKLSLNHITYLARLLTLYSNYFFIHKYNHFLLENYYCFLISHIFLSYNNFFNQIQIKMLQFYWMAL